MPRKAASLVGRVDRLRRELEKVNAGIDGLYELGLNREGIIVLLQAKVNLNRRNIEKILSALEGGLAETYFSPVKEGEELATATAVARIEEYRNGND